MTFSATINKDNPYNFEGGPTSNRVIHNFLTETGTSPISSRQYIVEPLHEGSLDHSQKPQSNVSSVQIT